MNDILFYTGIGMVAVGMVLQLVLAGWLRGRRDRYGRMSSKMDEYTAVYRRRRLLVAVLQVVGVVVAIIGVNIS